MKTFSSIDEEMIHFLQDYLRINTAHPKPDYHKVCALFKAQAHADGFSYKEIILPSGHPVIIISFEGSDNTLPSLALNHHMDVVPAPNTIDWASAPFDGKIVDDIIIARGVQDMKAVGVAHYFALKALKNTGIKPKQTIHLFAVPDEEIGGFTGTQQFVETDIFKKLNVHFVLDEAIPSGNNTTLYLKVSERKPIQVELTVHGALSHASQLNSFNALHELVALLHEITQIHGEAQRKSSATAAGLLLSMNITSLTSSVKNQETIAVNVIPDKAHATIDMRVPPGMKMDQAHTILQNIIAKHPHTTYKILATVADPQHEMNYTSPLFEILSNTLKHYNLHATQLFFEASTDLRYYKELGIDGIGLTPFTCANNIHGTNESLPIADFIQGKNIFVQFLKNFCAYGETNV